MQASYEVRQEPNGWSEARASLRYGKRFAQTPREVYFRSSLPLADNADFLVPLTLVPAMVRGESLEISGCISTRLQANLARLQDILALFASEYGHNARQVDVRVEGKEERAFGEGRGVACFFSGGVDSMYTALTRRDELSALVFIHGLDFKLDSPVRDPAVRGVRAAAAEIGLPLVEIETNAREFGDRFVHWELYSGGPLAATALLLQPHFRKFYIAGGRSLATLFPHGTHPLLDPLWGTESVEIENDALAERWQKIEYLADSEVAQRYLRVCYVNIGGAYNCGECIKCSWVMAILAAFGALNRFEVFEKPLDLETLVNSDFLNSRIRMVMEGMVTYLAKRDTDPEVLDAMIRAIRKWNPNFGAHMDSGLSGWLANAWPRP